MFKFYRMRYQTPRIQELNCSLEDAFEIARDEFVRGSSCCQVIIDEENYIIYSLLDEAYKSGDFEYELQDTEYTVYDCRTFEYIDDIKLIEINYKGKLC